MAYEGKKRAKLGEITTIQALKHSRLLDLGIRGLIGMEIAYQGVQSLQNNTQGRVMGLVFRALKMIFRELIFFLLCLFS